MNERLNSLLKLLEKDPDDSFVNYGIALEYMSVNNTTEAEKHLNKIIETDKDYVPAYMQLGLLFEKNQKTNLAKQTYKLGIEAAKRTGELKAAREMEDFLDDLG